MGTSVPAIGSFNAMTDVIQFAASDGVQDITLGGLNGDTDGNYQFYAYIVYKGGSGVTQFYLRPLASNDTNLLSTIAFNNGSGAWVTSLVNTSGWYVGQENNAADQVYIVEGWMSSKSGRIRYVRGASTQTRTPGGILQWEFNGYTTDTSTVISNLILHASVAGSMRTGSYIWVRKQASALF